MLLVLLTARNFESNSRSIEFKNTLIDNNTIISNDKEVAEAMNDSKSLGLTENREVTKSTNGLSDPIEKAIMKYSKHPSIRKIRSFAQINDYFKFQEATLEQMHSETEKTCSFKGNNF